MENSDTTKKPLKIFKILRYALNNGYMEIVSLNKKQYDDIVIPEISQLIDEAPEEAANHLRTIGITMHGGSIDISPTTPEGLVRFHEKAAIEGVFPNIDVSIDEVLKEVDYVKLISTIEFMRFISNGDYLCRISVGNEIYSQLKNAPLFQALKDESLLRVKDRFGENSINNSVIINVSGSVYCFNHTPILKDGIIEVYHKPHPEKASVFKLEEIIAK